MKFKLCRASNFSEYEKDIEINTLEDLEKLYKKAKEESDHYNLMIDLLNTGENYKNYDGLIINFEDKTILIYDDLIE